MINSPYDKEFVFQNGERAKNLVELVRVIENLSDHGFNHFVNHSKNDFANWSEHVLKDKILSEKLRSTHSKDVTIQMIKDRIIELYEDSNKPSFGSSIVHVHKKIDDLNREEKHSDKKNIETAEKQPESLKEEPISKRSNEHEDSSKNRKKWFKFFSKKNSDANLSKVQLAKEIKIKTEKELKNEIASDDRENTLWVVLYFALISLITVLLIYRIFFKN